MYQDFFDDQRDEIIDKIYAETVSWFAKNKDRPLAEVFYLYLQQAGPDRFRATMLVCSILLWNALPVFFLNSLTASHPAWQTYFHSRT